MKSIFGLLLALLASPAWTQTPTKVPASRAPLAPNKFDITSAPSQGDWQRFHILTDRERTELWQYHVHKKLRLKDWSWQWRLGWLRSCGSNLREKYCDGLLTEGLDDAAMVVRAEAANQFSHAHAGSRSKEAVAVLVQAYARPDNFRNGKPLFVCEQILRALQEIGGNDALREAKQLAAKDPHTKKYWNALTSRGRNNDEGTTKTRPF